jgi:hypothetical protein
MGLKKSLGFRMVYPPPVTPFGLPEEASPKRQTREMQSVLPATKRSTWKSG